MSKKTKSARAVRESKRTRARTMDLLALGGVNEIGKNIFCLETPDELLVIDCWMSFPSDQHLGVNYLIPDFSYLLEKRNKIVGIILTHGHEDHIGGLPFLPDEIDVPVYGTPMSVAYAEAKLGDHGTRDKLRFQRIEAGDEIKIGSDFKVEPFHVTHSMPDAVGYAIHTPAGLYVHSGDFKFDLTPVDNRTTDIAKLSQLGKQGVDFLTVDVTNVERPGFTPSERSVGRAISRIFDAHLQKRIFIAMFASNIHRIQQIIDLAEKFDRVVAPIGRSMEQSVHLSIELGYLKVPKGILINSKTISSYKDEEIVILATGSQGEPMSALTLMSQGAHRVAMREGDVVVISANPIPGNESAIWRTIDSLCKLGADVIYRRGEVHVSGHGSREEIKMMCSMLNPTHVMPFHGEHRHVSSFRSLLDEIGLPDEAFVQPDLGRRISISGKKVKLGEKVKSGMRFVDGLFVEEEGTVLLDHRRKMSQGGLLVVNVIVDKKSKKFKDVSLASQGFISAKNEAIFERAENMIRDSLRATRETDFVEYKNFKKKIEEKMERYLWRNTNRRPSILTNIIEV